MAKFRSFSTVLAFMLCFLGVASARAQALDRAQLDKEIDELWEQIKVKQDLLLEPAPVDKEAYAEFLKQPDTGLIRLLPREKYDYKQKLPIRGGGSYYSFVLRTHEYGGSDIGLEQGKLKVGFGGMDFGYLISLGDIDLDKATLEHPAVKALAEYQPPPTEDEVRAEWRQSSDGHKVGEFLGLHSLPAKELTTYTLRSLNYDQWDILVAFRVVRQDADGSLILIWKLLKTFPKPTAIRSERN
jgi:hypothetical protein